MNLLSVSQPKLHTTVAEKVSTEVPTTLPTEVPPQDTYQDLVFDPIDQGGESGSGSMFGMCLIIFSFTFGSWFF